jgi:hypothetical protein
MQSPIAMRIEKLTHPARQLARKLSGRTVLLASGLSVVFAMMGFQWLEGQLGAPMLDMMADYQRDELFERLQLYGEDGRVLHARFTLLLDMVFPLLYGALFAGLISLAARGTHFDTGVLAVGALMFVDWAENLQLLAILWGFPNLSDGQIAAASATTQAKVTSLLFVASWLLGVLVLQLARRLRA